MRFLAVFTITADMIIKRHITKLLHYFVIFNHKGNLICSKGLLVKITGKICKTYLSICYENRRIWDWGVLGCYFFVHTINYNKSYA